MLILIAGATGNLGQLLVHAAISRGHQVRALGRTPDKMASHLTSRLESFIQSASYHDISALDTACAGIDAVIVAYQGIPTLQLDGQLLLLRAAERAGVTRFVAASWNYDWRGMALGQQESYDAYIALRRHVELSSSIRPVYIFTGVLAEVLFSVEGHGDFSPRNHGVWDPVGKGFETYGTGEETWHWTTERDAAELTLEILGTDGVGEGGFWTVYSGENTLAELAAIYGRVRGTKVSVDLLGSVEDLRRAALEARAAGSPQNYWAYIGYFYQLYTLDRTWALGKADYEKIPNFKPTTFEEFLLQNPDV